MLQKAAASKGQCSEKADSNPHLQGPQDPWGPTGPTL